MKNLRLKSARAAKDLSQEELAKLCVFERFYFDAISISSLVIACMKVKKIQVVNLDEGIYDPGLIGAMD